jgi:Short C-terminal domain/Domain of unknown function (DUF4429)
MNDDLWPTMRADGHNGQIRAYDDRIVLSHQGVLGFLTNGIKGDKTVPYSSITAVQFKEASIWTNGYIQFSLKGGLEDTRGIFAAATDENTVMFRMGEQAEQFARLKAFVEGKVREIASNGQLMPSSADEIAKYAALRDRGIITEDEFQKKKRSLLDL